MTTAGRNDPCPCGSGQKYKRCCGRRVSKGAPLKVVPGGAGEGRTGLTDDERPSPDAAWEVDLIPLPGVIEDALDARSAAVLVVGGGLVLQVHRVDRPPSEPVAIAALLAQAVREAAEQMGFLPPALLVRQPALAGALAGVGGLETVAVRAQERLPALDAAAQDLVTWLGGGPARMATAAAETWRGWGLPTTVIRRLFRAAAAYYRARPWRHVLNEQLLAAEMPSRGGRWTCCVLGNGGSEFGLALYADPDDFFRQLDAESPAAAFDELRGLMISLLFSNQAEIPRRMRKEILAAGWEVAGPDAYPALFAINTPGGGVTRGQAEDLAALLGAVPRFVVEHRTLLRSRVPPRRPMLWQDVETGVVLHYEGNVLVPSPGLWDPPESLAPALPAGPNAEAAAALRSEPAEAVLKADRPVLERFRGSLREAGLSPTTVRRHTDNAELFVEFLAAYRAVPLRAVSEYDLRVFVYDWYPRKVLTSRSEQRHLPVSLKRFFRFLAHTEGLELPWAWLVLQEREAFDERCDSFPGGFWWDPEVQAWQAEVYADLEARALLPDGMMAGGVAWGETMGPLEAQLEEELQRRWLIWRDEVLAEGIADPADVRAELVRRQRAWETAAHPAHAGATPVEVVRREREDATL